MSRDPAALEAFSTAYRPLLLTFFARRVRSWSEAEDLTQEVFMRLADADLETIVKPEAYLYTMAANLVRDRARREHYRLAVKEDYANQPGIGVEYLDPHRLAEGQELLRELDLALRDLPERTRRVFVLYRIEGLPMKKIASELGISLSGVEKHVRRGLAFLVDRLEREP
ncbi:RNA polymerase sigma factor [Sphingopyxis sp. YR583]|uniref:RNA polymerase sigma factor n=1 Tax=Sphingopyxis sp. YR583 TaxID=1881047 RepID=UPI0015A70276|nr:sigma-70 family RNA polymerase sigma factor [Sphingopyxis sp. YR583]